VHSVAVVNMQFRQLTRERREALAEQVRELRDLLSG
jgi:hypothetical protein